MSFTHLSCYLHLLILPNEAIAARPELGVLKLHPLLHAHQFRQRELNILVLSGLDECEWNAKSHAKTVCGPQNFVGPQTCVGFTLLKYGF